MDLVLKLREIRRMRGLTQKDVARLSGIGEKTISSFETGMRIGALKLDQLERILAAYGLTPADFFSGKVEREIAPWELDESAEEFARVASQLSALPKTVKESLLSKFELMVETAQDVRDLTDTRPHFVRDNPEWHMLTSRN